LFRWCLSSNPDTRLVNHRGPCSLVNLAPTNTVYHKITSCQPESFVQCLSIQSPHQNLGHDPRPSDSIAFPTRSWSLQGFPHSQQNPS